MTLEGAKFEGELQEFANHAFSLRCALECLKSGGVAMDDTIDETLDQGHISLACDDTISNPAGAVENSIEPQKSTEDESVYWERTQSAKSISIYNSIDKSDSECISNNTDGIQCLSIEEKLVDKGNTVSEISKTETGKPKETHKHVDILPCESLASLAPATLERLFNRDYDIIVSMIPLPSSSVLPGASGSIHFGPPSFSTMTPWMKLILYTSAGNGPLSVALMKGQRLRMLPDPLAGCAKALIWSWDGSTVGGLGAFDDSGKPITIDVALPLKNGSIDLLDEETRLGVDDSTKLEHLLNELSKKIKLWTIGYIRLIRLRKVKEVKEQQPDNEEYEWVPLNIEFGISLFSPKLCSTICQRVISSNLLQSESLSQHYEAMYALIRKLHDICSDNHSTSRIARLLYLGEKGRDTPCQGRDSLRQLLSYASRRWNLAMESSSPMATTPDRHHGRCAILIFHGSILRSYALSPSNEAAMSCSDDSTSQELQS